MSLHNYGVEYAIEGRARRYGVPSHQRVKPGLKSWAKRCLNRHQRHEARKIILTDIEAYSSPLPCDTLHYETMFYSEHQLLKRYKQKPRLSVEDILNSQKSLWK